ncbi:TetR/AcrR family transcriptional regulator [Actinomadura spongiicola]|uniref:TetR/AcrR family transcriptional regulator n=1 Tax=Actinomadura spongiicola TaxID=2303421 RepID=A0A372G7M2_9ACTN|nr:helix-turn-helix domain-containing protein [Actinomadura spongiicola]RFS81307.1 TetR/AcrR family transcriptional regulator [Actinomadura spongiicola]
MREWVPVSTSPRGRLALAAVEAFGTRPFAEVTVTELAAAAQVTTGALYHHFGSKLGLYAVAREDVERRLLDRMEGAMAAAGGSASSRSAAVTSALLVGLDFAVREGFLYILGDPPAGTEHDRLAETLSQNFAPAAPLLGRVLAAAWRAALTAVAAGEDPAQARAALAALRIQPPDEA